MKMGEPKMTDQAMQQLIHRVSRLEDERAIRDLKARYLRACDLKDVDTVRDTLLPEGAIIEYEGFPRFTDREPFVAIYREMGTGPGIFDIHHAANGIVSFVDDDHATAQWSLIYHNINLSAQMLTQLGVEYDDEYVRQDGHWWIAKTQSRRNSFLMTAIAEDGTCKVTAAGEPPEGM